jgi:hypothetical protein
VHAAERRIEELMQTNMELKMSAETLEMKVATLQPVVYEPPKPTADSRRQFAEEDDIADAEEHGDAEGVGVLNRDEDGEGHGAGDGGDGTGAAEAGPEVDVRADGDDDVVESTESGDACASVEAHLPTRETNERGAPKVIDVGDENVNECPTQ